MLSVTNTLREPAVEMPARLASIPPFPSVALRLLTVLSNEEANFSDIAACIATDPALAGKLIKRANAADQATYCEASNVLQAVSALGLDRTREVSMAIATSSYAGAAVNAAVLRPCWHHTLASALIAAELARQCGLRPAEAYTAGLLHDIGRLGLLSTYPAEYEAILAGAAGPAEDLLKVERERFGVDHEDAGEWLAHRWNLPESIVDVLARHPEPPSRNLTQTSVVHLACRLADLLGFSVNPAEEPPDFEAVTAHLPEWTRSRIKAHLPLLRQGVSREIESFEAPDARVSPPPEAVPAAAPAPVPPGQSSFASGLFLAVLVLALAAAAFLLLR